MRKVADSGDAVIGDRAYGKTVEEVALMGRAAAEGLIAGGVLPVIKHIPGHGRAMADSHLELPETLCNPYGLLGAAILDQMGIAPM